MTSLLTPETFEFFARFLLAGFVTMSARARFVTGERPKLSETVAEAVILSLVNQFLFRTIFFWLPAAIDGPRETEFLLLAEVLILPGALGLFAGWLVSRNWMPDGARRLILPVTRPVPQAFDHAFAQAFELPVIHTVATPEGHEGGAWTGDGVQVGRDNEDARYLVAPRGERYAMQAYAQIVDKTLDYDELPKLGERLKLPHDWRYEVMTPRTDIVLGAKGEATVIQDDLENTYQKIE